MSKQTLTLIGIAAALVFTVLLIKYLSPSTTISSGLSIYRDEGIIVVPEQFTNVTGSAASVVQDSPNDEVDFSFDDDLNSLAELTTVGIAIRNATSTWSTYNTDCDTASSALQYNITTTSILCGSIAVGSGDNISVNGSGATDANFIDGDIDFTLDTGPSPDTINASISDDVVVVGDLADNDWGDVSITSNVASIDANAVALGTDTTNAYVADLIGGTGIGVSGGGGETATITVTTASGETDFLASGALTCGAATQGRIQVHTTPLQYCDNAGTPTLRYAAYGNSSGESISIADDTVVIGDLGDGDWGDVSVLTNVVSVDADAVALGADTTNAYVTDLIGGSGISVSGGGSETATITVTTASSETDFLVSGALTCGAVTQGRIQVHTTPLQYCDNDGTPTLRYAAYGESDGDAVRATQLAANGANCTTGNYPLGVDEFGAVETCTAVGAGGGDSITVLTVAATDPDFINGDIDWTLDTGASPDTIAATVACSDCVALGTETANAYVADLIGGAGISVSGGGGETATITVTTTSSETDFLVSGALTCGASTQGKIQVHTTPIQYCDNTATPTLRYAAYGNSSGEAISYADDSITDQDFADDDWGDVSVSTNVVSVDADAVALGTDTTNAYVTDLIGGSGISVSGGGAETATITVTTASSETDFLASGALTCGAATRGRIQVHTTPLQYCDNAGTPVLQYAAYGNSSGESTAAANDSVALGTDTTNAYVADLTGGAGISVSGGGGETANITVVTASGETDFLASGALTCGAATQGKIQVHTTALQYCDNAGTPTLRYTAYGLSTGEATGVVCTSCVDVGDIDQTDNFVWTGTHDFGGAPSIEIVNAANPTIDASGEVAVDTTDDQFVYQGGTTTRVMTHKKTISFLLETPNDVDNFLIRKFADAMTLLTIDCITDPADAGESVVVLVQERNSTGDSPVTMDSITCDSDGAVETVFTDSGMAAAGWMSIDIGVVTGTVTQVVITVEYTLVRE